MRKNLIITGVAVLFALFFGHAAQAAPSSFSMSQTCGDTSYTALLTLITTGSTPAYTFSYTVNGEAGTDETQEFTYNGDYGFAEKVEVACNAQNDLGIFIMDTAAPPKDQSIFGSLVGFISYRTSVAPIFLYPDGSVDYTGDDPQAEIVRRLTRSMTSQNVKYFSVQPHGDDFFLFFGSQNEVRYLKLEYTLTALDHTYLDDNDDATYLYKYQGCEMLKGFTLNAFSPDITMTVPVSETYKVSAPSYPSGYGCRGSSSQAYSREVSLRYDAATQKYTQVSARRITEVTNVTVTNGTWTAPTGTAVQPLGAYTKAVASQKVYLGYGNGSRFIFVPKEANTDGAFTVYDENGALVKKVVPFGAAGKRGLSMTSVVMDGSYYVAVGHKGGNTVKVYTVNADGVIGRGAFAAATGANSVVMKYLKVYEMKHGLVTLAKVNGKNVVRVWKYNAAKKAFLQDKGFNLKRIKVKGTALSL